MTANQTVLEVEGMSCGCCANRIGRALDPIEGVSSVAADLEKSLVFVQHDGSTSTAALISATSETQSRDDAFQRPSTPGFLTWG